MNIYSVARLQIGAYVFIFLFGRRPLIHGDLKLCCCCHLLQDELCLVHTDTSIIKKSSPNIHWRLDIGHGHSATHHTPIKIWNSPLGSGKMRTSHLSKITIKTYTDEWHTPRIPNLCWHLMYVLRDAWKKNVNWRANKLQKCRSRPNSQSEIN